MRKPVLLATVLVSVTAVADYSHEEPQPHALESSVDVLGSSLRGEVKRIDESIDDIERREEIALETFSTLEASVRRLQEECCGTPLPAVAADADDGTPAWVAALAGGIAGVLGGFAGGWLLLRLKRPQGSRLPDNKPDAACKSSPVDGADTTSSDEYATNATKQGDGRMAERKKLVVKVLPAGEMKPIDMEGNFRVEIYNHTGLARLLISDTLYDREKDVDRLIEILRESGAEVEDRRS